MNEHKIAFIACVNNPDTYAESLLYLQTLSVPPGWEIETLSIEDAHSMTAGYQAAMLQSDAKYKIYMHQDVFLYHREILIELISLFQKNPQVGMIGLAGCWKLPASAIWWETEQTYEHLAQLVSPEDLKIYRQGEMEEDWKEAEAVDGFFIATQYDFPWQETFGGWHFYDISQCQVFRDAGLKIAIPRQDEPWCVHECLNKELDEEYFRWQKVFQEWSKARSSHKDIIMTNN